MDPSSSPAVSAAARELTELIEVMDRLRRECAWTSAQTHTSLRSYVQEEAEEVAEAIDAGDSGHLRDELGDVLLQVVFHSRIAEESEDWNLADVVAGLKSKLVRRNPHVFDATRSGEAAALTAEQVDAQWQRIKAQEKNSQ